MKDVQIIDIVLQYSDLFPFEIKWTSPFISSTRGAMKSSSLNWKKSAAEVLKLSRVRLRRFNSWRVDVNIEHWEIWIIWWPPENRWPLAAQRKFKIKVCYFKTIASIWQLSLHLSWNWLLQTGEQKEVKPAVHPCDHACRFRDGILLVIWHLKCRFHRKSTWRYLIGTTCVFGLQNRCEVSTSCVRFLVKFARLSR